MREYSAFPMQWKITSLRFLTEKLLQIEFKNAVISTMQNYITRVISVIDLASKTFISVLFCLLDSETVSKSGIRVIDILLFISLS